MNEPLITPTARWDRDLGTYVELDSQVSPRPPSGYTGCQVSSSGLQVCFILPRGIADRAEAAGIEILTVAKATTIRRLTELAKEHEQGGAPLPPARGPKAAEARTALGTEIQLLRQQRKLNRRTFAIACQARAAEMPGERWQRGWSPASAQAWETGIAAPRQIEPLIQVLTPDKEQADRWRRWWLECRVGLSDEDRARMLADLERPADPTERLRQTLAEAEEQLAAREAEQLAGLGIELDP